MSLCVGLTPAGLRGGVEHQGEGFLSEHFHQTAAQISRRLQPLRQDLGQGQRSTRTSEYYSFTGFRRFSSNQYTTLKKYWDY